MLYLNLLPDKIKKEHDIVRANHVTFMIMLICLVFTIVASLIFIADTLLDRQMTSLLTKEAVSVSYEDHEEIVAMKTKAGTVGRIQSEMVIYSDLVEEIDGILSQGIIIDQISVDTPNKSFRVEGNVSKREVLKELQDNLQKSDYLSDVVLKRTNILDKGITFRFIGKVNFTKL